MDRRYVIMMQALFFVPIALYSLTANSGLLLMGPLPSMNYVVSPDLQSEAARIDKLVQYSNLEIEHQLTRHKEEMLASLKETRSIIYMHRNSPEALGCSKGTRRVSDCRDFALLVNDVLKQSYIGRSLWDTVTASESSRLKSVLTIFKLYNGYSNVKDYQVSIGPISFLFRERYRVYLENRIFNARRQFGDRYHLATTIEAQMSPQDVQMTTVLKTLELLAQTNDKKQYDAVDLVAQALLKKIESIEKIETTDLEKKFPQASGHRSNN